jgi:hypothetical protein
VIGSRFGDRFPTRFLDRRATLAAGYGTTALVFQPPTLGVSYHFVFSVLLVGLVLALPAIGRPSGARIRVAVARRTVDPETPLSLAVTGISAVTIGWAAYLVGYLLL